MADENMSELMPGLLVYSPRGLSRSRTIQGLSFLVRSLMGSPVSAQISAAT